MDNERAISGARRYLMPSEGEIEVFANSGGGITITQATPMSEDQFVSFSVEKVDRLIGFLLAVKDEVLTDRADEAAERAVELGRRPS